MDWVLFTAGVLQIFGGIFAWLVSASAMHEILAASLIGFGVVALGLGAIIERMNKR